MQEQGLGWMCAERCCHLFTVDLTLDRVKEGVGNSTHAWWLICPACIYVCLCVSAWVRKCMYVCVCVCVMRMHAHFGAGSPCSLLLSPLCEACPPLEGPGVPAECVEVASSWSLQEAGFWGLKRRESERGIHPSIRASIHIPPSKPQTRSGESRKGGERGGEGREGETQRERERERPYEFGGKVRVTSVRVHRRCEGPSPAYILLAGPRAPLPISQLADNQRRR